MKTTLLILLIAFFASCSTAYKSGQTPDDLYYSKPVASTERQNIEQEQQQERIVYNNEDRQIRMAIRSQRWRTLDYDYDYDYAYSPYRYGYNYGYYYNPVYYPYPVYNNVCAVRITNPKNTTIRSANLGGYNNTVTTYSNTKLGNNVKTTTIRGFNNNQQSRRNNNSRSYDTRTYSPSTPSNNSSGSSAPSRGTAIPMPSRGGR